VPLCLPSTPDERLGVRVLSALQHLAEAEALRGNSAPAIHLGRLQREEQALLGMRMRPSCCRQEPSGTAVQAVMALTRGLRLSLADEQPLLTHEVAVATLKDYVAAVTSHDAECAARRRAS
jgi:hypothetical protein